MKKTEGKRQRASQEQMQEALSHMASSNRIAELFQSWRRLENSISEAGQDADGLIDAQSLLMHTAALMQSKTPRDVLFKLAFWRCDAPDLDVPLGEMQRGDAVVYSAYRDLVHLTGATEVLTKLDKETNLLRNLET